MQLQLPEGPFKAYLFDCDGTIVDSMPLHYVAWKKTLAEWKCDFPEDVFYRWGGMPTVQIVQTLSDQQGLNLPAEAVAHAKEQLYYELLPQLQAVPEVLEHIDLSHGKIPFAVVSGGSRDSVTRSLNALGILDRFDTLVCAEDYVKPKPDAEPFQTDMGIQAATAAGMASVKILQPWERPKAV
jgi:beta-phosphoglucomutase-like phosphatase (HAD superfamily)